MDKDIKEIEQAIAESNPYLLFAYYKEHLPDMDYHRLRWFCSEIAQRTHTTNPRLGIDLFTLCLDRRYPTGNKKRSSVQTIIRSGLESIFSTQPDIGEPGGISEDTTHVRITWDTRKFLRKPENKESTLLIDARGFNPEGDTCDAALGIAAYKLGWKHLIHYNSRGTRFHGAGFGPSTQDLRIDCYDNPGDYLGSGMDGLTVYVHGNAQDQVCQISKNGKIVIYGDVGQTFLYGAKGGSIYVLGNAAGRPMINAVGRPRVVINGTALDFLAESFMAGDPLRGGGFAIVNGLTFTEEGTIEPLDLPYPGSNLLSLASGGAIYIRDPHKTLVHDQLNEGEYTSLTDEDWKLIVPFLKENEKLFGIEIDRDLLTVDGEKKTPREVYRKVVPVK